MGPSAHVAFHLWRLSSHRNRSPEYQRKPDPYPVWASDDVLRSRICFGLLEKTAASECDSSQSFDDPTPGGDWIAHIVRLPAGQFSDSVPTVSASIHAIVYVLDKAKRNYCIGYAVGRRLVFRSQIVMAAGQGGNLNRILQPANVGRSHRRHLSNPGFS